MAAVAHHRALPTAAAGLVALLAVAIPAPAAAQAPVVRSDSGVTFDFQDADIRAVIAALADVAHLNIVYGSLPQRTVTLRTGRPVPLADVRGLLESVATANGLRLTESNGILRIVSETPDEPRAGGLAPSARPGARPAAQPRLFVYRLKHVRAETIAQTLRALFGLGDPGGLADLDQGAQTLSQTLQRQQAAPYPDTQGGARDQARGAEPRATEQGLAAGFTGPVDIVPDRSNNALLVLANPTDYETLQGAITELDLRPLQVLIEVLIAEVRHDRNLTVGVDADVPLKPGDSSGITFRLPGASAGGVALSVLGLGAVKADIVLQALATSGDVKIVSRPVILAQNNHLARILVGDQRPFIQLFRSLPTDAAVRDQVVQYRNVGTELNITPTINDDGYVNLSIAQQVNSATAESQFGAPVINTREAETQLLVKDGHTVVIGGLIDNQLEKTSSGIPILKDIPVLGLLFGSHQSHTVSNELFILLTPHVLRTDDDLERAARELREAAPGIRKAVPPIDSIPLIPRPDSVPPARPDSVPAR